MVLDAYNRYYNNKFCIIKKTFIKYLLFKGILQFKKNDYENIDI